MKATENPVAVAGASICLFLGLIRSGDAQNSLPVGDPVPLRLRQDLITTAKAHELDTATTPTNRIEIFNGKDFDGWTFSMKNNANPMETWSITNGVLHCTGKSIGYLRTEKSFRDYKLTVEWRFVKIAPKADNTGVLIQMQLPDKVWPTCVQVQGKHGNQGDLILMAGAESKEHRGMDANIALPKRGPANEKPVGQWDTVEAVCQGNSVKAFVNGKLMNETTECTVWSGFIGIQSEGAELEVRQMFLEPVKATSD
jgi:Domain of Unknown Function (DUF1080)